LRLASTPLLRACELRACVCHASQVLPKPHLAAMFSMAYYTPGVLELLESLVNPAKYGTKYSESRASKQKKMPAVPLLKRACFAVCVRACVRALRTMALRLLRYDQASRAWYFEAPSRLLGRPYAELALEILASGAVPLGLFRAGVGEASGRNALP